MRVVSDGERLVPPFLCHLCETHPQRENGVYVIDTGWNFDPPAPTPLNGRKLVCSRCVEAMANLIGWRSADEVDEAKRVLEEARQKLKPIQEVVESLAADIGERMQHIWDLPTVGGVETSKVVTERREKEKEKDVGA